MFLFRSKEPNDNDQGHQQLEDSPSTSLQQQEDPSPSPQDEQELETQPNHRRGCFSNLNPPHNDDPMPELTANEAKLYKQLQRIQYVMDDAVEIPFLGGRRVGLDPIVGLIPGVGDFASATVSIVLVAQASRHLSKYTTSRMLINVAIDATLGMVPLVGDIFDVGWQANARNVAIFEDHMKVGAERRRSMDRNYIWTLILVFVIWIVAMMALFTALLVLFILWVTGKFPPEG